MKNGTLIFLKDGREPPTEKDLLVLAYIAIGSRDTVRIIMKQYGVKKSQAYNIINEIKRRYKVR